MPHYAHRYQRTRPHYYEDSDACAICDNTGYAEDGLPCSCPAYQAAKDARADRHARQRRRFPDLADAIDRARFGLAP